MEASKNSGRQEAGGKKLSCVMAKADYLAAVVWQEIIVLTIVAVTVGLFARSYLRRGKFRFERQTHCGCGASSLPRPQESIVFRARKGEQPEIMVKMR